jgi:hypothetical protein
MLALNFAGFRKDRCARVLLAEIVLEFLDSPIFALTKVPSSSINVKVCITLFANMLQQLDILSFFAKKATTKLTWTGS